MCGVYLLYRLRARPEHFVEKRVRQLYTLVVDLVETVL